MVTEEDAKDPELKDEVAEEAANYGVLRGAPEIVVLPQGVKVYLTYTSVEGAAQAVKALNGRYFAGNTVKASLVP